MNTDKLLIGIMISMMIVLAFFTAYSVSHPRHNYTIIKEVCDKSHEEVGLVYGYYFGKIRWHIGTKTICDQSHNDTIHVK